MPDAEAVELATAELARIGLLDPSHVTNGVKVRVPHAYPMYDPSTARPSRRSAATSRASRTSTTFGRNGLHRYNNQDHSMWTAMLATRNHLDGDAYDVWSVNTESRVPGGGPARRELRRLGLRQLALYGACTLESKNRLLS